MATHIGRGIFKTLGHLRRPLLLSRTRRYSDRPWNLGKLNHVAIAVPSLEGQTKFYRDVLGAKVSEPMELSEHGVTVVFIELGDTKLELLQPLGEKSPIAGFLKKKPTGGMHHICIETVCVEQLEPNQLWWRLMLEEGT